MASPSKALIQAARSAGLEAAISFSTSMRPIKLNTVSIPRPLHERLKRALEGAGYRSATEFVATLLGGPRQIWRATT